MDYLKYLREYVILMSCRIIQAYIIQSDLVNSNIHVKICYDINYATEFDNVIKKSDFNNISYNNIE